jgi:hypothetical protein
VHTETDVLVIGAGAAGLMCAIETGRRGRSTVVIDHMPKPAEKIRISGGGRCNFTNLHCHPDRFISANPHFCVSALSRYSQHDFIAKVASAGIPFHEKTLGQLFCDRSSRDIIDLLLRELHDAGACLRLSCPPPVVEANADGYAVRSGGDTYQTRSLVVATGGLSIPKIGATAFAFSLAAQFGLRVVEPRPGLVPFTFSGAPLETISALAGVSVRARSTCAGVAFEEGLLFTHRGLSGPCALQISSYWRPGEDVVFDLLPGEDMLSRLRTQRAERPKQSLATLLHASLPRRLVSALVPAEEADMRLGDLSDGRLRGIVQTLASWRTRPAGTEGWRTAEVTCGGVDTRDLSSKTLEARQAPGLFFVGECVDVTGWLGGYNFQWAWSSGWAAGQCA